MKKRRFLNRIGACILASCVAVSGLAVPVFAEESGFAGVSGSSESTEVVSDRAIAFPGAEGGGMYASGARGAFDEDEKIEVYHVTNLNDDGEGSFRDAVSKGNRIVVFDVSGYIDLSSNVNISQDNITVLGQTAPGDGITLRSNNVKISGKNKIIRFLKFRVGAHDANGNDTRAQDGLEVTDNAENIIIDHCSVSWGTDENLTAYAVKDVTIQNCIIAEALNQSVHDKGEHSYAAIWGGVNLSIHHNIIASHKSRNPKIGTSETVTMTAGYTDAETLVDMKNNVIYNWGDKAGYGTENGAKTYIQNNIYKPGPATPSGKRARIFELSVGQKYETNMLGSVYAVGNKIDVDASDSDYADAQTVNLENWQDDKHIGVYVDTKYYNSADKSDMKIDTPNEAYKKYDAEYPVTLDDTEDVFDKVIANAGATLPKRDKVDERIVGDVVNRTAPTGSKGSVGLLDDPIDGIPAEDTESYDDRGYPIIVSETRDADYDTDGDGIPDEWEDKMGLNKSNPLDGVNIGPNGLTWLEIYVEQAITNPQPSDVTITIDNENLNKVFKADEAKNLNLCANITGDGVESMDFYIDDKIIGTTVAAGSPVESPIFGDITSGNHTIVARGRMQDGSYVFSDIGYLTVIANDGETYGNWYSEDTNLATADADTNEVTIAGGSGYYARTSEDFKAVVKINEICNTVSGVETGISCGDISIGKRYNSNFEQEIYFSTDGETEQVWSGASTDIDKYTMFEIERTGTVVKLYAGTSLADIENNVVAEGTISGGEVKVYASVSSAEVPTMSSFGMLNLVLLETKPKISLQPEIGQIQLSGDSIEVTVEPHSQYFPVTEIWLYLDGVPIASKQVYITSRETISIPVTFTKPQRGTLTAYCFDENLGKGSDSQTVAITQNPAPWQLSTIGEAQSGAYPYVEVTDDYTFKISGAGGSIGTGSYDNFTYLNQKFSGNTRMYYRSRMQNGKQFGVVFRSDLYASPLNSGGTTYFFGGTVDNDGNLKYQLIKRATSSDTADIVADVTDKTGQGANLYFIAEKVGDTINIYQTENSAATIYTTKTLLTSVKCEDLGDEYYMGFGVVADYDETNIPDAGWVGLENIKVAASSDDTYIKSYQDGVVTINKGVGFSGGKTIVCGYNVDGALVDVLDADVVEETTTVGQVAGDSYKVFLWNNFEEMMPLCEPYDGTSEPIEAGASEKITWNFDYGLDWLWEMQESNVLKPSWTSGINGNETGIMALEQPDDYESGRYVFREYQMSEDYVPQFSADVLLTGDEPGLNVYMQTGDTNKAYKITFADDGKIYTNGSTEAGSWSSSDGWYNISVTTVDTTGSVAASLTIAKADGTAIVDNQPIEISGTDEFRTQKNVEKKTPVTKAVYFEPEVGASGKYYIDNVTVTAAEPSIKVEKATSWYTFKDVTELSGAFTVNGTTTPDGDETSGEVMSVASGAGSLAAKSYNVGGVAFSKRIRLNKNKAGALTVPVKTGSTVTVYCGSANSSSTRSLFINGTEYSVLTADAYEYSYDGDPGTIEIYAADGIDVYGVSVETVNIIQ